AGLGAAPRGAAEAGDPGVDLLGAVRLLRAGVGDGGLRLLLAGVPGGRPGGGVRRARGVHLTAPPRSHRARRRADADPAWRPGRPVRGTAPDRARPARRSPGAARRADD